MCLINNKKIKNGGDIIAYKIFKVDGEDLITPYMGLPMKLGESYFTGRKGCGYTREGIGHGFYHTYKNLDEARLWVKNKAPLDLDKFKIVKVLIPNQTREDIVYEGDFYTIYSNPKCIGYASNRIKLLEYVPVSK